MINLFNKLGVKYADEFLKLLNRVSDGDLRSMDLSKLGVIKKRSGHSLQELASMANDRVAYATDKAIEPFDYAVEEPVKFLKGALKSYTKKSPQPEISYYTKEVKKVYPHKNTMILPHHGQSKKVGPAKVVRFKIGADGPEKIERIRTAKDALRSYAQRFGGKID